MVVSLDMVGKGMTRSDKCSSNNSLLKHHSIRLQVRRGVKYAICNNSDIPIVSLSVRYCVGCTGDVIRITYDSTDKNCTVDST